MNTTTGLNDPAPHSLSAVFSALRKANKKQYVLVTACVFCSVLLITALSIMMNSNTVMRVLPEGGDSRKQMNAIFAIAIGGCAMFTVYASSLFFKSKSRETGVMLALGAAKSQISRRLFSDIGFVAGLGSVAGLALGTPLAAGIWQLFRLLVVDSVDMGFSLNPVGYLWGGAFAAVCIGMLFAMTLNFLRRTNIMDIVNDQRKSEPIRDAKAWYGIAGLLMMFVFAAAGYSIGGIFISFDLAPPAWGPLLYLPIAPGLYMFLVFIVVRGGGKKTFYKNIISRSIMRFQGRQTVRNMAVITALVGGAVFAVCYVVMQLGTGLYGTTQLENDYLFHYRADENMPTQADIRQMAAEEGVLMQNYAEAEAITLATDGVFTDYEDDGSISKTYHEQHAEENFLPVSEYNRLTGQNAQIEPGRFAYISYPSEQYVVWDYYKDIKLLTNPVTGETTDTEYSETFSHMQIFDWFVISDADYATMARGITPEWREKVVQFDVADAEASYPFAARLKNTLIDASSPAAAITEMYDRIGMQWDTSSNSSLTLSFDDRESSDFSQYWKYSPSFRVLTENNMLRDLSVYVMLFTFIAVVCFAAVYVIAYTRSITIALVNKQVYNDLHRLGANRAYLRRSVRGQISKVYAVPVAIGSVIMFALYSLLMYGNDGNMQAGELIALGVIAGIIAAIGLLTYALYRKTLGSVNKMLRV